MAEAGIAAGASGRVQILDSYLDAHSADHDAIINVAALLPAEAFNTVEVPCMGRAHGASAKSSFACRGIKVGSDTDAQATVGVVNSKLNNDPIWMEEPYVFGIQHSSWIRFIRPFGTTARGITLYQ